MYKRGNMWESSSTTITHYRDTPKTELGHTYQQLQSEHRTCLELQDRVYFWQVVATMLASTMFGLGALIAAIYWGIV